MTLLRCSKGNKPISMACTKKAVHIPMMNQQARFYRTVWTWHLSKQRTNITLILFHGLLIVISLELKYGHHSRSGAILAAPTRSRINKTLFAKGVCCPFPNALVANHAINSFSCAQHTFLAIKYTASFKSLLQIGGTGGCDRKCNTTSTTLCGYLSATQCLFDVFFFYAQFLQQQAISNSL